MAIFGLNFNRTEIPTAIARRFPTRIGAANHAPKITGKGWTTPPPARFQFANLVGVATTIEDCDRMLAQANNGNRTLFVIERSIGLNAVTAYGIYVW